MSQRTIGAYPSDSWFDPTRPSWLPYWVDTTDESAKKYGLYPGIDLKTSPPAPPAPYTAAPPAKTPITTAENHNPSLPAQVDAATQQRAAGWLDDVLMPFFSSVDASNEKAKLDADSWFSPVYLLYAGIAVGAYLLLTTGRDVAVAGVRR